MIKVLSINTDVDLSLFSQFLVQRGVPHRIFEESGQQQLWVQTQAQSDLVLGLYSQYDSGQLQLRKVRTDAPPGQVAARMLAALRSFPVSLAFVVIGIACFPLTFGMDDGVLPGWLHWFTFVDFQVEHDQVYAAPFSHVLASGQFWRLWSPMFVHFGVLHLVFNMLWTWEIGRRIEIIQGSARVFNVILISSPIANIAQFLMTGPSLFGGMSGVVYGLLGYSMVWSRMRPAQSTGLPDGVYVFMLVWLALGFTGLIDSFDMGAVANGAHLGGLLAGILIAAVSVVIDKRSN